MLNDLAKAVLDADAFPVRAILFDKTHAANWKVGWHQDVTIPVRARADIPGYGSWSVKEGVPHVQPPVAVLERMVAVRLHLDDCGAANGPLRVIPRSHIVGRLSTADICVMRARGSEVVCTAQRGDVILMRPLVLHASSSATVPIKRRVLHIEYAADALPAGLQWFEAPIGRPISRFPDSPITRCV